MSMMRREIETDWPATLAVSRAPEMVLAEAHEAAAALKRVIDAKPKKVQFGGETYLEHEDWQTVGRFYGIAPRITGSRYVDYGGVIGWEASAEAVHVESGKVVSSADSMCLTDEEHWRARARYEWHYVKKSGGTSQEDPGKDELIWERGNDGRNRPKKLKVQMPDEPVPMFQLRSMAQTRASAKALRNALAWVVVLAGYKPTPAEEMDSRLRDERPAPSPAPAAETPEQEAARLFATPQEEETRKALERIRGAFEIMALAPDEQRLLWDTACPGVAFLSEDADPAALQAFIEALIKKHQDAARSRRPAR